MFGGTGLARLGPRSEPTPAPPPPPLTAGFLIPPAPAGGQAAGGSASTLTSEFMAGTIVYSVVFVESAGGAGNCAPADTQTENWSVSRRNAVLNEIAQGLSFWTSRAERPDPLNYVLDDQGVQPTSCEPIGRPGHGADSAERLWAPDVLTAMGFPATSTDYHTVARAFIDSRRTEFSADWGFLIFVIDSLNDSNGTFADGSFAYSYLNGPFTVMTYDNASWGISRMNVVTAHETGHVFGALDEYAGSGCSTSDSWGYLNAANTSCNGNGDRSDISIMGDATEQLSPSVDVSASARSAVGWRNPAMEFGQTIVDVVRTSSVSVTPYTPDPTSSTMPALSGSAANIPFPPEGPRILSGNPYGTASPISISKVAGAEWTVAGQPFTSAGVSIAGADERAETASFTFGPETPLAGGTYSFSARAVNNFGNRSAIASDTLTILGGAPTMTGTPAPVLTPTPGATAVPAGTTEPTDTSTPVPTPAPPGIDSDGDGCSDERELGDDERMGGRRDPNNPYDFYDVNGDGVITIIGDVLAVAGAFGPATSPEYDPALDRSPPPSALDEPDPSKREPWDLGPPDGAISIPTDLLAILRQYGHRCA